MIDSNLAVLLAERNLKITKVSRDTGISRTTLTALCYDHTAGIKFDTLNTLCQYLNVTPTQFFNYTQYDYEVEFVGQTEKEDTLLRKIEYNAYEYTIKVIIKKGNMTWTYPVRGIVSDFQGDLPNYTEAHIGLLPFYLDNSEDATPMDLAAINEFRKMCDEMTKKQVAAMIDEMYAPLTEAFVSDFAKDYKLKTKDVVTDENILIKMPALT